MKYTDAFDFVIGREGGYVNDPNDPGGETKYGISKRQYPNLDIKNLTLDDARKIYKNDYWDKVSAKHLPEGIRLAVFDSAVNQGVTRAIKMLQRAALTNDDGIIGPNTLDAVRRKNPKTLLNHFLTERMLHYASLSTFKHFGKGWTRRLFHVALESKL